MDALERFLNVLTWVILLAFGVYMLFLNWR